MTVIFFRFAFLDADISDICWHRRPRVWKTIRVAYTESIKIRWHYNWVSLYPEATRRRTLGPAAHNLLRELLARMSLMQIRSQLENCLILKGGNAQTAEIAMGHTNSGAERLLVIGHMLAKTGDTAEPVLAQVPTIDMEHTIPQIARLIRIQYRRPVAQQP